MRQILGKFLALLLLASLTVTAVAQTRQWREMHKVKKKETIFGIARQYGLTVEELIKANPEMANPDYKLKKGDFVFIPYATAEAPATSAEPAAPATPVDDVTKRAIRLGIMLPLHDVNGDGRRMVEYYRGVLLACDSLKKEGISVDIHAWNVPEGDNMQKVLDDPAAARCDLIIGPLYSTQVTALSAFVEKHDIKLVIPFSIRAPQLATNRNIFQVYQTPVTQNETVISYFARQFKDYHPVIVDCNDSTSTKGLFTSGLRRKLETSGIDYSITNSKSSEVNFLRAFSQTKPNVVVLNTGRSQELGIVMAKLNNLVMNNQDVSVTVFGYTDWLLYTKYQLENFYKFNVHIPSPFYMNPLASPTTRFQNTYRSAFHQDMMNTTPRFAMTGFDHAVFFLRGLHRFGKSFDGARGVMSTAPLQTPLHFERLGNGGLQNRNMLIIHYMTNHRVETVRL